MWGRSEVKGTAELILKCCPRRDVFDTSLNPSSAGWKSSGKETLTTESHSSENSRTLIGYLGEVFSRVANLESEALHDIAPFTQTLMKQVIILCVIASSSIIKKLDYEIEISIAR